MKHTRRRKGTPVSIRDKCCKSNELLSHLKTSICIYALCISVSHNDVQAWSCGLEGIRAQQQRGLGRSSRSVPWMLSVSLQEENVRSDVENTSLGDVGKIKMKGKEKLDGDRNFTLPYVVPLNDLFQEVSERRRARRKERKGEQPGNIVNKTVSSTKEAAVRIVKRCPEEGHIVIRHMEKKDISAVVDLCVEEYGSYSVSSERKAAEASFFPFEDSSGRDRPSTPTNASPNVFDVLKDWGAKYESFAFSLIVRMGMMQRVHRREQGDLDPWKFPPDHNVLCLEWVHSNSHSNDSKEIIGIAEISLQPPYRTAPPFVMSTETKEALASWEAGDFFSFRGNDQNTPTSNQIHHLEAYISNVLIKESHRGIGMGKLLMNACERHAKGMGHNRVTLHVDANARSGAAAQQLYLGLGYEPILRNTVQHGTGGGDGNVNGIYFIEGVPLLYLIKNLV